MDKKKITRKFIALFKLCIAVFIFWYLFKNGKLSKDSFSKLLDLRNLPLVLISCLIFMLTQALATARLIYILKTINLTIGFYPGFKLTMIGNFFNNIILGSVGGDIIKGFYLSKSEVSNKGRSFGILIIDRLIGLLSVMLIAGISTIYLLSFSSIDTKPYHDQLILALYSIVILLLGFFLIFFILGKSQNFRQKLKEILYRILHKNFIYYIIEGAGALAKYPKTFVNSYLISILIQILTLMALLILSGIMSETIPAPLVIMAVSSIVILVGAIPVTPGNIGWVELVAALGWTAVNSNAGAEVFLYWRSVSVLCSLPGGLFYLFISSEKRGKTEISFNKIQ